MAYALLAQLSPQYGLYTSFTGAALYWLFGTSKDIAIGVSPHHLLAKDNLAQLIPLQATAVVSLLVGKVSTRVLEEHPGEFTREEVTKVLAFLGGVVLLVFG